MQDNMYLKDILQNVQTVKLRRYFFSSHFHISKFSTMNMSYFCNRKNINKTHNFIEELRKWPLILLLAPHLIQRIYL